jgi:hypothetical protein
LLAVAFLLLPRKAIATSGAEGAVLTTPQTQGTSSSTDGSDSVGHSDPRSDALAPADERTWRTLFQEARSAFGRGRFQRARALYLEAYALKPTAKILGNLAQVEISLQKYVDAATHAEMALRQLGRNPGVERDWATAKRNVGTLRVTTNVDGALVEIDGEPRGRTPLEGALYVEPGEHEVRVTVERASKVERRIQLEAGMEQRLDIALVREDTTTRPVAADVGSQGTTAGASSSAKPIDEDVKGSQKKSQPNPAALVSGGVLVVGGLGLGLWFNSRAESRYDTATTKQRSLGTSGCSGTAAADAPRECERLLKDLKDGDRDKNWAIASFAVGGAALVGTALYWFWPRDEPRRRGAPGRSRSLSFDAGVDPKAPWVGVSGRF